MTGADEKMLNVTAHATARSQQQQRSTGVARSLAADGFAMPTTDQF